MKHLYIAAAMIEEAGLAETGTDLFVGTLPADVKLGVMLKDPLYGAPVDKGMRGFYDHWFQVIVRHPDPAAGYELARSISRVLDKQRFKRDGLYILTMNPSALPVTYPKGDADDVETAVRIHVAFGELTP
jgi:hypothetical protein